MSQEMKSWRMGSARYRIVKTDPGRAWVLYYHPSWNTGWSGPAYFCELRRDP